MVWLDMSEWIDRWNQETPEGIRVSTWNKNEDYMEILTFRERNGVRYWKKENGEKVFDPNFTHWYPLPKV